MFTTCGALEHIFKYVHIFVRPHIFSENLLFGATCGEHSNGSTFLRFINYFQRVFSGYQNHLTQYRPSRQGRNGGYDNDLPLVLRQGRTVTIFNDGITQNEKLQGFEIGLELAAQEFCLMTPF